MSKTSYSQTEQEFIERVIKVFERQGLNPTVLRIYISIFLSTTPLGLKEISERTGYSMSTVCTTMDIVERNMDVRAFKKPGSKKVYYECLHNMLLMHRKKMEQASDSTKEMIVILTEAEKQMALARSADTVTKLKYVTQMRHDYERFYEMFHKFCLTMEFAEKNHGKTQSH